MKSADTVETGLHTDVSRTREPVASASLAGTLRRVRDWCLATWVVVSVVFAFPVDALAHSRSVSYSTWQLHDSQATVVLKVSRRDLTSLTSNALEPVVAPAALAVLQSALVVETQHSVCRHTAAEQLEADIAWLRVRWSVDCDGPPVRVKSTLFSEIGTHIHFATMGEHTWVLSPRSPTHALTSSKSTPASLATFVQLGVRHIATGWDHLLFLLLLVVIARGLSDVAKVVTGFTIGHSATLALSAFGYLAPFARPVEAAIASSILIVATENTWLLRGRGAGLPALVIGVLLCVAWWATLPALWGLALFASAHFVWLSRVGAESGWARVPVAGIFGLLHGFGFAGVLAEGTARPSLGAIFGFNLGVEIGQLALVVLVWPILVGFRRLGYRNTIIHIGSWVGAACGTYALVFRAFG